MNNIIAVNVSNPTDIALQIAARVKARRLELDLTQEGLATRVGIKFATYRRLALTKDGLCAFEYSAEWLNSEILDSDDYTGEGIEEFQYRGGSPGG